MSKVSAQLVKELREKTGAGIKDCQEALAQNALQVDKAADWLRQKGISRAEKKADRVTAEGAVGSYIIWVARLACSSKSTAKPISLPKPTISNRWSMSWPSRWRP